MKIVHRITDIGNIEMRILDIGHHRDVDGNFTYLQNKDSDFIDKNEESHRTGLTTSMEFFNMNTVLEDYRSILDNPGKMGTHHTVEKSVLILTNLGKHKQGHERLVASPYRDKCFNSIPKQRLRSLRKIQNNNNSDLNKSIKACSSSLQPECSASIPGCSQVCGVTKNKHRLTEEQNDKVIVDLCTAMCDIRPTREYQSMKQFIDKILVDQRKSSQYDDTSHSKQAVGCSCVHSIESIQKSGINSSILGNPEKIGQHQDLEQSIEILITQFHEGLDANRYRKDFGIHSIPKQTPKVLRKTQTSYYSELNAACSSSSHPKFRPFTPRVNHRYKLVKHKRNSIEKENNKVALAIAIGTSSEEKSSFFEKSTKSERFERLYAMSYPKQVIGKKRREDIVRARKKAKELPTQLRMKISPARAIEISGRLYGRALMKQRDTLEGRKSNTAMMYPHEP